MGCRTTFLLASAAWCRLQAANQPHLAAQEGVASPLVLASPEGASPEEESWAESDAADCCPPVGQIGAPLDPFCGDPDAERAVAVLQGNPSDATAARDAAVAAWNAASRDRACRSPRSVDYYYQAAAFAWHALQLQGDLGAGSADCRCDSASWSLYHRSLTRLLIAARCHGRLHLPHSVLVNSPGGPLTIPIVRHGFPWIASDFDSLEFMGSNYELKLRCRYCWSGLGVKSVVIRHKEGICDCRDVYFRKRHPFAATWVLRPDLSPWLGTEAGPTGAAPGGQLDCFDPLRVRTVDVGGGDIQLAGDTTAPLAWFMEQGDGHAAAVMGFRQPGSTQVHQGIYMLEPYQPGKIPVVFVHGLLGDPFQWLDLANDLHGDDFVASRYQLWAFNYPTGESFLDSAAKLREDLQTAACCCDPGLYDPALGQMVMVGHSMGGLLTKLQICRGGDKVWNAFVRIPFSQMKMSPSTRGELRRRIFFQPNPLVRRAVFVATPHDGSPAGLGLLPRGMSMLVKYPEDEQANFDRAKADNPRALRWWVRRRLPTSVDMLASNNRLLQAMRQLPIRRGVSMHTIYGCVPNLMTLRPSDRVVPISSGRHGCVESEIEVRAGHSRILAHSDTSEELRRILRVHVRCP